VSYQAVITRIAFVTEAATPQLTFKPMGFLDEPTYRKVLETADTDVVRSILGTNIAAPVDVAPVAPVITPEKTVTASEVEAAVQAAEQVVRTTKPSKKAEPVKEAVPAAKSEALGGAFSLDLDTLKFDD
jgi:hypothetical protein